VSRSGTTTASHRRHDDAGKQALRRIVMQIGDGRSDAKEKTADNG